MNNTLEEEGFQWAKRNRKKITKNILSKYTHDKFKAKQIIFLSGSPGSGKTEFINGMLSKGFKEYFLHIDLDELRKLIPGYTGDRSDIYHKGAIKIMEWLLDKAFKNNLNIILDGTFASKTATERNIRKAQKKGYDIKIYYIKFDPVLAWKFTLGREIDKKRKIPFWSFYHQYFNSFKNIKKTIKNNSNIELTVLNKFLTKDGHSSKIYKINSYDDFIKIEKIIKPQSSYVIVFIKLLYLLIKYRFIIKKGLIHYNKDYE